MNIDYTLTAKDGRCWHFAIDVERGLPVVDEEALPAWTALAHDKCRDCPLGNEVKRCPAAVDLAPVIEAFASIASIDVLHAEVSLRRRVVSCETSSQEVLRSLIGLIMGSSRCPILRAFLPNARTHVPFASLEETLMRSVGLHLVRCVVEGRVAEVESLRAFYRQVAAVNTDFTRRIRSVARRDANINALVSLFSISVVVDEELDPDFALLRELLHDELSGSPT